MVGGFVGAVAGPPFAVLTGICGFFLALWARVRFAATRVSASPWNVCCWLCLSVAARLTGELNPCVRFRL